MRAVITLCALGPVEVTVAGEPAPREILWRKNLALLMYLARSPDHRRTREHLVGVLWGDKPDAAARHSLNEALRVIRRAGGDEFITSVGDQVALSPDGFDIDAAHLEEHLAAEEWEQAAGLVRSAFLEGFALADSFAFEDWLAAERAYWSDRMGEGLRRYAESRLARGDTGAAQEATHRALSLDPFSDAAVRLAMLASAVRGERAAALSAYDAYAARLENELGLQPDPETEALADRIREEREWRLPETVSETERWARRVPLVGRERELQSALAAVSGSFRDRVAGVVLIQGESGSGKTRLAEEITARVRLEGAAVSSIRAVPSDMQEKWDGVGGLCRGLAPDAEPGRGARALVDLARAVGSSQPVLLWVDGAEHLDPESAGSLQAVVRDLGDVPCTILLTAAPQPPRSELEELRSRLGRDLKGTAIMLHPLDTGELQELTRHVLPELEADAVARLARRIQADSAGLPLLAVELLNAVRLGLELDEVEGAWPKPFQTMEQTYPGDLPDSVVAAIRIGFRRLGRTAQRTLTVASVLDEPCAVATLEAATGLGGEDLYEALDELEWNRWIVAEPRGYTFVARIVRDVVARDMLTAGQRQRILEASARS